MDNLSFLVTGGAGFIGSHIAEYLLLNGAKYVRIVDNLSTGSIRNISHLLDKYNNLEFIYGDLVNPITCTNVVKDMDIICHQAALGSIPRSINDPLATHNSNVNGFMNLLVAAKDSGIKRFVYASSSSVYGDIDMHPKIEQHIGTHLSPYAVSKYMCELYGNLFGKLYDMECIGLRYFNVFGPRQSANNSYAAVIPTFINNLLNDRQSTINGDGGYTRDFTYVANVVDANMKAMLTNNNCGIFNIGCGSTTSINKLYQTLQEITDKQIPAIYNPPRRGDIAHSLADITKAQTLLQYTPRYDLLDGLKYTVDYYKNNMIV